MAATGDFRRATGHAIEYKKQPAHRTLNAKTTPRGHDCMKSRIIYLGLVLTVLALALVARISDPVPVARLRLLVFDTYQWLSPRPYDPEQPVRIVDIDDQSLRAIGQWPWPRSVMADMTRRLIADGAAAIGFDVVMAESDRGSIADLARRLKGDPAVEAIAARLAELPSPDAEFAGVIGEGPVVLGFIGVSAANDSRPVQRAGFATAGDDPKLFASGFDGAVGSLMQLQEAGKGSGSLNWVPEYDQIIRRVPVVVRIGDGLYPSLSAELLRVGQGAGSYVVKASGASGEEAFGAKTGITDIRVGQVVVPTDAYGQMWLRFSPSDARRFIPATALLAGTVPRSEIEGRIILIGTSAAGLFDLRTTPLDAAVPGVEVHAQAIEQMLLGIHLRRPDFATGAEIVYLTITGALMALVVYFTGAMWSALFGASILATAVGASWAAFAAFGWLFDPVYPAIALTCMYIATTVFLYLQTERERRQVRNAFSHYMAPALVEELARNPDKLRLGGEMRNVTLMFCDVRSFTSIAERLNAEQLTAFLNRLLTPFSTSIMAHRGTIDKYIGDSVMAFWNAPLDDDEHERHAARAALAMTQDLARLNETWRAEAAERGETYKEVRIGVGLNTADCCVGNLGSEQRFDYSVIGDGVNVASRLEGQSKTYGLVIIVGEATARAAPELAFLEVDLVSVVGRAEALRVFALLGDEAHKETPAFQELAAAQQGMLAAFRSQRFADAEAGLARIRAIGGAQYSTLCDLYARRIAAYRIEPPPDDWDGSSVAETK